MTLLNNWLKVVATSTSTSTSTIIASTPWISFHSKCFLLALDPLDRLVSKPTVIGFTSSTKLMDTCPWKVQSSFITNYSCSCTLPGAWIALISPIAPTLSSIRRRRTLMILTQGPNTMNLQDRIVAAQVPKSPSTTPLSVWTNVIENLDDVWSIGHVKPSLWLNTLGASDHFSDNTCNSSNSCNYGATGVYMRKITNYFTDL